MPNRTAVEGLLVHLRDWWQGRDSLAGLDAAEFESIARDLGISTDDLRTLAAHGPHAADLLIDRMAALGVTKEDVERTAAGLMHDMQRTCSNCAEKGVCARDLADRPLDPGWKHYCPNADTFKSIEKTKGRFAA